MSGDVSLAADVTFPNPKGYDDRKAVLVIRQDLDDNSKEVMTALHGAGFDPSGVASGEGRNLKEACRIKPEGKHNSSDVLRASALKDGDTFALFVSLKGEPMHQVGTNAKSAH